MVKSQNPNDTKEYINNTLPESHFRSFIVFWIGQLVSILGSEIVTFALIWWVTIEKESSVILGLMFFFWFGPLLALTPFAGVYVDRWNRKKIIATVDFFQALVTVVLIYLFMIDIVEIWHILVLFAFRGACDAFHRPAVQAIVPLMVPKDKISRINGVNYLIIGMIFLVGPVIAALLYVRWEIHEILWVDVVTFLIAIVPLLFITIPSIKSEQPEVEEKPSFTKEFKEGIGFIKEKKGFFSMIILFTSANFFLVPLTVLLPLLVRKIHGGAELNWAFLLALEQAGAIIGSIFMSVWKGFERRAFAITGSVCFMYLGMMLVALAPEGAYWFMGSGMFLMGFSLPLVNVTVMTALHLVVPPDLQGRVFSMLRLLAVVSIPPATLLAGFFAEIIGIVEILTILALLGLASAVYLWFMTDLQLVDETLSTTKPPLQIPPEEK
ncbi:MAG: MFS transporter, partial [Candidatus Hodarchaeota archaeon]